MARRQKAPMTEAAHALKLALRHLNGEVMVEWTDGNVAAILALGGSVRIEPSSAGRANMVASVQARGGQRRATAILWDVFYVEPRANAKRQALFYDRDYAGWDQPPPPPLTAEQLEALAAEAAFQASEFAMVAAAERELAAEKALLTAIKVAC